MMYKNNKWLLRLITVLAAAIFLLSVSVLTAAADPGDDGGIAVGDDGGDLPGSGSVDDGSGDVPMDDGGVDSGDGGYNDGGSIDGGTGNNGGYDSGNSGNIDSGNVDDGSGNNGGYDSGSNDSGNDQDPYAALRDSYINRLDDLRDNLSQYDPNQYLDTLPTVAPAEVAEATAEPLPDVEISDATLFSGIVMWLCVAVGISVVVGVMVSRRTHRKGA